MKKTIEQIPFITLRDESTAPPLYRQIYEAIRAEILNGIYASGMRLPSTRELAQNLSVSRITVVNAYDQLLAEGYLEGRSGAGTFVAGELPEALLHTGQRSSEKSESTETSAVVRLSQFGNRLESRDLRSIRTNAQTSFIPFQNGLTAISEFPFEVWSRISNRFTRQPNQRLLGYGDPQGFEPLREAVAAHLRSSRGVKCSAAQVVITSGAQQALDLASRIFLEAGTSVVTEDPCYIEARNSFSSTGAKVIPVTVDSDGLDAGRMPVDDSIRLAYVTPSHQYPLGVTMTLARRLALIEWAKAKNAWIIEDDYNSEFRYSGRPLAALQGLDSEGRVIYVGTFSKTIFPGLRLGCLVVPNQLVGVFANARALNDVHSPLYDQAVLAEFIAEGHFSRHLRRMRALYAERQSILIEQCRKELTGLLQVEKADAGMHIVGWLNEGVSDKAVSAEGRKRGLRIAAVSDYSVSLKPRGGIILGYTAFNRKEITNGVKLLRECLLTQT